MCLRVRVRVLRNVEGMRGLVWLGEDWSMMHLGGIGVEKVPCVMVVVVVVVMVMVRRTGSVGWDVG
jgi:hypothetical protein